LIYPLNDRHWSGITHALTEFNDAAVSAWAGSCSWCDLCEQFAHGFLLAKESDGKTAGMQVVAFGLCDQLFSNRAQGLGFAESGFDAAMLNQAACQVGEQRFAVGGFAFKLSSIAAMSHRWLPLMVRNKGWN
jgi:hypothetical protein